MEARVYTDKNTELVERCRLGERAAQFELYKLYSRAMLNVSMRILNHIGEAEDVVQEAFVDAFTRLDQFRHMSTFGAWLKQIVVNKAITQLRQRKVEWVEIDSLMLVDDEVEQLADDSSSDDSDLVYDVERVTRAMNLLPEGYRTVLSLYLFEGYDHEEISEILSISESTSRTQYMRAKQRLIETIRSGRRGL